MDPYNPTPYNLKTNHRDEGYPKLPNDEPIDIVFSRQDRTVKFLAKTFDLYQTDLPRDEDFRIAVVMR